MPIDTGNKIYIHMPKTGGSWMSQYLCEHHSGQRIGGHGHQSATTLGKRYTDGKMLWATIRDPWSWYLSWYAHGMRADHYKERYAVYGGGSTEFKDVLMGVLSRDPQRCPERSTVIWHLPNEKGGRKSFLESECGLYSWTFFYMFGDVVRTFVEMSRMDEGILELFGAAPDKEPANVRTFKLPRPPEEMYDDEMVEAVYRADSFLISTLGYEDPFQPLSDAVVRI